MEDSKEIETKADPNYDCKSIGQTLRGAVDFTKGQGQWRPFIRTLRYQIAAVRN